MLPPVHPTDGPLPDAVLCKQSEDRKSECCGFAGARLRSADQIFPGQNNRKGTKLDWGWLDKSHRLRSPHNIWRKSEIIKRHLDKLR